MLWNTLDAHSPPYTVTAHSHAPPFLFLSAPSKWLCSTAAVLSTREIAETHKTDLSGLLKALGTFALLLGSWGKVQYVDFQSAVNAIKQAIAAAPGFVNTASHPSSYADMVKHGEVSNKVTPKPEISAELQEKGITISLKNSDKVEKHRGFAPARRSEQQGNPQNEDFGGTPKDKKSSSC
ncbi:hypothetical protein JB92DRAFT_3107608 [Gautieria morchelliformis]|nr:hypothetical protein JB92DRAFT_3107608 [Gautieria morchelliformis]